MAKNTDVVGFGQRALERMTFAEMMEAGVISIEQIDDRVMVDQEELVGVPFVMFKFDVKQSESFGGEYAVVDVKTVDGTRAFSDGGTGICKQLQQYKDTLAELGQDVFSPIYFPNGLRASHYMYTNPDGAKIPATTYYFDNAPAS